MRQMLLVLFALIFPKVVIGAPIRVDWSYGDDSVRLYLPCNFGKCLVDTGGQGNILAPENRGAIAVIDHKTINFVFGKETCNVLAPTKIQVAEREFNSVTFVSCEGKSSPVGAAIGTPIFENARFQLTPSNPVEGFKWLNSTADLPGTILRRDGWFWIPMMIGGTPVQAMFDTGAPLTLIDENFFNAHPELFQETEIPSRLPIGRIIYLQRAITILGKELDSRTAMVMDLRKSLGPSAPSVILGLHHILEGDWTIDLVDYRFDVSVNSK